MKTKILKVKGDWMEVVDDCRATVGKESLGKEPSTKFKKRILISEHSPIRDIEIKFRWRDIPYWVAMHWKTHKWEGLTNTQRNDRQKAYDRGKAPQDAPVTFTGEANVQHLIDTMRKRLCYQASPETRQYAEDLKVAIREIEPEISDVLVPNCIYRCGCPELETCAFFGKFVCNCGSADILNIQERYDSYNKQFYARRKKADK